MYKILANQSAKNKINLSPDIDGQIVFALQEFNKDRTEMWSAITTLQCLLLKLGYVIKVRTDGVQDIIIVEYCHDEQLDPWGCASLEWLTNEEYEQLVKLRENILEEL